MYVENTLPEHVARQQRFDVVFHNEAKPNQGHQNDLIIPDLLLSLSPLGLIFIWAIFLFICQKVRSNLDDKIVFQLNTLQKVPCKNCRFFSNNHYLKCAVKPDIVLTQGAVDCAEYSPKKSKFLGNKLFG